MKMIKVSAAIAAYMAENNILPLINSLLQQEERGFELTEILIHCDGDEDKTKELVESHYLNAKVPVRVLQTMPRKGYANAIKTIFENTTSDYVITLNDDVHVKDTELFIKVMTAFMKDSKIGMVTGRPVYTTDDTFFGKALASTQRAYHASQYFTRGGHTAKTVDGKLMAFSRKYITTFKFPEDLSQMGNTDCYTYFVAITQGFKYRHAYEAVVYGKNPGTVKDYIKFTLRCNASNAILRKSFASELIDYEYLIPKKYLLKGLLKELFRNPLGLFYIFLVNKYIKNTSYHSKQKFNPTWSPIATSK